MYQYSFWNDHKNKSFGDGIKSLHVHNCYIVECNVWRLQLSMSGITGVISLLFVPLFFGSPGSCAGVVIGITQYLNVICYTYYCVKLAVIIYAAQC